MKTKLEALIFSGFLSLAILSQYIREPRFDSDILWSIAIGKWIDIHKAFPIADSFSWTINGREWMTHEWIYSFLAYKMSTIYGSLGIYIVTFVPIIATIYVLYLISKSYDKHQTYFYVMAITLGIVLLYILALPFRAYIYALLFVALLIYLLYFKEPQKYDMLLYMILFILWANFQVSVFIGLIILWAEMARRFLLVPAKRVLTISICMLGTLSTLVNPYGYKLWTYFLFVMTSMGVTKSSIAEWHAVDFNEPLVLLLYLCLSISIIYMQFNDIRKSPSRPNKYDSNEHVISEKLYQRLINWVNEYLTRESCLLIGFWSFFIYALYSIRMLVFALIFWIVMISYYLGKATKLNFSRKAFNIFILFFAVVIFGNLYSTNFAVKDIFTCDRKVSPVEEVAYLKDHPAYSNHLFNEYLFGGYLILNDIPVFIDARSDSYIKFGIQQKYMDITSLKEDPQILLDELGVENLLITNGVLKKYIDINPKWKLVYGGPNAFIYSRINFGE